MLHRRRLAASKQARFDEGLSWMGQRFLICYRQLQREHPGASRPELVAALNERMYRGTVPDHVLDAAIAEIRRRGEAGLPPYDK